MSLKALWKTRKWLGFIVLVVFTCSNASWATPQPTEFRFAGEEFYYSLRLNGLEAIRVGVRAGDVKYKQGVPYVAVAGTAQSTGFFNTIYPVNDKANTFVHPVSMMPLRSEKYFNENGDVRSYKVDFTHQAFAARVEKHKDNLTRKFNVAIPGGTHDMISWFYELRSLKSFDVGTPVSFYIYDGWKLSHIHGKVMAREDILTPVGWFKAWRIDMVRDVMNSQSQRHKGPRLKIREKSQMSASMWVSRDSNRLPIKVAVDTPLGKGEAVLIKLKLASTP